MKTITAYICDVLDAIQEERIQSGVKKQRKKVGETNQAVPFILDENAFRIGCGRLLVSIGEFT